MTTRRNLIAGAAALVPLSIALTGTRADAQDTADHKPEFLFVQSAEGIDYSDGKLTLKNVSPVTILFSDRPDRIAGHMSTESFVPFWSEGADSFKSDNPNANLSILDNSSEVGNAVVELHNPVLNGKDLSYEVTLLEGDIPAQAGAVSLFIDMVGRPLTPVSFAGASRRSWRR